MAAGVFVVNLLLGWTMLGWFAAFIWSCTGGTTADVRREKQQRRELPAGITRSSGMLS
jgi:hypothetical protein